jgi:acrylyl-CoA reductase (NADPH)
MDRCKAYRIYNDNNTVAGRVEDVPVADIGRGEVLFRTAYSSVNFKDALAATGAGGKIIRNYPLTGGIDAAGTVISSGDARFRAGDEIICTSYDMGVAHDGGFSEICRVPADWVVPLPRGLTLFDAMALGTAGYTAGLAVELLELN